MAYIGTQPLAGQYRKLDDISSGFNGATTSFTTSVGGTNVTAGSPQQLLVSLGGVIQQPTTDYTVNTNTITFTTAPGSGLSFFAVLMGDALNTSVPADGSITSAKLAGSLNVGLAAGSASTPSLFFSGDANTGIYSPGADQVSFTTGGTERLRIDSTGQIESVSLGTAAAPTYSFTTDPNTGIYSPGADQVAISTGGTNRFQIDSSGNITVDTNTFYVDAANNRVGVGTTSPGAPLDVVGSADTVVLSSNATNSTTKEAKIQCRHYTNAEENLMLLYGFSTSTDNAIVLGGGSGNQNAATTVRFFTAADTTTTSGTERARIDSSGRLLVGTSSSVPVLSSLTGAAVQVNSNSHGAYAQTWFYGANNQSGAAIMLAKSRNTTYGSYTAVQSGDSLGGLYWAGDDGSDLNNQAASILCWVDGTPGTDDMPGRLVFSTTADGASSPTERMRIRSTGQVWINQTGNISGTGDSVPFQVTGNGADYAAAIANGNASPYGLYLLHGTDINNSTNTFLFCQGSAAQRAAIRTNGGFANYQANDVNLSDRNAKKDITPAAGTWDCIKEWEIVNYRYKDQPDDADLNLGVIAQQVAESCPEVITVFEEAKDNQPEKLGVKEQQMYWMAIKALQEAQVRIEALEAEVAALKAQ